MAESTVWQAVLGELELSMSKANFETWLRNTKLQSLSGGVAVVSVPNIFIRSRVESHYKDLFLASFQKHAPDVKEVHFAIAGSKEKAPPRAETMSVPVFEEKVKKASKTSPTNAIELPPTVVRTQTFDTFVEGNTNRLAYTVSKAVANNPGTQYNPLFIYGGVGLGKTHLMHAIANDIVQRDPTKRVLYVSTETFTNDYIAGISTKSMSKFKNLYRSVDLLLVDDIQFIGNKEGSQEEFFNTFNTLHQSNRQIVIAADRVPKAIPGLEERLSSRFGWGMVVDVQPPNLETRFAILQSKCQEKNVVFPVDALEYIAEQVQSNIRELEGALNRVIIYCQMSHVPFSHEATKAALSGLILPTHRRTLSIDTVFSLIAEHFGIDVADIIGKKRNQELVYPRHITMYLLREAMQLSFPEIGREMGKDHTTIMHGHHKVSADMESSPKIQSDLSKIKERMANI